MLSHLVSLPGQMKEDQRSLLTCAHFLIHRYTSDVPNEAGITYTVDDFPSKKTKPPRMPQEPVWAKVYNLIKQELDPKSFV